MPLVGWQRAPDANFGTQSKRATAQNWRWQTKICSKRQFKLSPPPPLAYTTFSQHACRGGFAFGEKALSPNIHISQRKMIFCMLASKHDGFIAKLLESQMETNGQLTKCRASNNIKVKHFRIFLKCEHIHQHLLYLFSNILCFCHISPALSLSLCLSLAHSSKHPLWHSFHISCVACHASRSGFRSVQFGSARFGLAWIV